MKSQMQGISRRSGEVHLRWIGGSGIGAFASHSVSFVSNLIHDNWGDALLVDIDVGGSTDITVANNIFYDKLFFQWRVCACC
jgi:hypothetical protein